MEQTCRKKPKKKWNSVWICLCLLLFLTGMTVSAASGGIRVWLQKEPEEDAAAGIGIVLYQVAVEGEDFELVYTEDFQEVPFTSHELFHEDRVQNAQILSQYVKEQQIVGKVAKTDQNGSVVFAELENGAYLIDCKENQSVTFVPFLVFIPTEIDAEDHYIIESKPKIENNPNYRPDDPSEEPPEQNEPSGEKPSQEEPMGNETVESVEVIPQTGENMILIYALIGAGVFLVLLGIADIKFRSDTDA